MRRFIHGLGKDKIEEYFIMVVKTDNAGTTANNQFLIPTITTFGRPYDYTIKTSDGQVINNVTGNFTITFPSSGIYEVWIKGEFPRIRFAGTGDALKLLEVKQWGGSIIWNSFNAAFQGCQNALFDNILDVPNIQFASNRDIMSSAFRNCTSLVTVGRLNEWNLSQNNNLNYTFGQGAKPFNQDISDWDVSNVTDFSRLFDLCQQFNNGGSPGINNWDTSKGINFNNTFNNCQAFNQPLNNWDVSNATSLGGMFATCISFNQPIGNWNTSKVTNMAAMFQSASVFNQDIGSWDVSKVTTMFAMFRQATNFNNGGSSSINNWDTSSLVITNTVGGATANGMFYLARAFNQPIGNWDMSNVNCLNGMFASSNAVTNPMSFNQDIGSWDVSNVVDANRMFQNSRAFNQDISDWDVSNVENFENFMINRLAANFDVSHLNAIYNKWSLLSVKPNVNISFGGAQYNASAQTGKNILTSAPNNWIITDGGVI
jgi:surface protein